MDKNKLKEIELILLGVYGEYITAKEAHNAAPLFYSSIFSDGSLEDIISSAYEFEADSGIGSDNSQVWYFFDSAVEILEDGEQTAHRLYDCFMHCYDDLTVFLKLIISNSDWLTKDEISAAKEKAFSLFDEKILESSGVSEDNCLVMNVIFLDIDGVLNSRKYDSERNWNENTDIDETRLPLVKEIADRGGAVIVLSSTWRTHWHKNPAFCDEDGAYINDTFSKYGLEIYSKTPDLGRSALRKDEVKKWLETYGKNVRNFVILDDYGFGWGELSDYFVKTNPVRGLGLEEEHVQKAVKILLAPKRWEMKLAEEPFKLMETGKKTAEVRLYDAKRRKIEAGDTVVFTSVADGRKIETEVERVTVFNSFKELFASPVAAKTGTAGLTQEQAAEAMYKYYSADEEKRCGAVAIEIKIIK